MKNIKLNPGKMMRAIIEAIGDDTVLDRDTKTKDKSEKPKMYKVLLHNSDAVDGHLVMKLLKDHFKKSDAEAYRITINAHQTGMSIVGVYTRDVAETRTDAMVAAGLNEGYNILMTVEEE